jgi:hypothetical protein
VLPPLWGARRLTAEPDTGEHPYVALRQPALGCEFAQAGWDLWFLGGHDLAAEEVGDRDPEGVGQLQQDLAGGFRSLQEGIDTTTPGGKLVFHIFAALAEFEHDLVRERTTAGLAAARARGRRGGRPTVMTQPKIKLARQMYASKQYTVAAIAAALGVSRASVYRHLGDLDS